MSYLSKRVLRVKPSPTLAITAKAKEMQENGQDILNLAGGEPDFPTPEFVRAAAINAMNSGQTKYTAVQGSNKLLDAIITKFKRDNNLEYARNQVMASTGGKQAIYNALAATIDEGDEVIIPAPYWVSYPDMVLLCDGIPVIIDCPESSGFKLTAAQLEKAITPRTKWVMLNSPNNPCGCVYTKSELESLATVLEKYPNVLVMSDDVYECILFDGAEFSNIAQISQSMYDRTLIINAVSKSHAMTGWRLGYAAGPSVLINAMTKLQSQSTSNPSSISQAAAIAALTCDQSHVPVWTNEYQKRRDKLVNAINDLPGFSCISPAGAFYLYINCAGLLGDKFKTDMDVADNLLESVGIALTPGTAFGLAPYLRISFAVSDAEVDECIIRLKRFTATTE